MRFILTFFAFFSLAIGHSKPFGNYRIVPFPNKVTDGKGELQLGNTLTLAYPKALENEASLLQQYLLHDYGIQSKVVSPSDKAMVRLVLNNQLNQPDVEGSYRLDVSNKGVVMAASGNAGILYAIQTFRQMIDTQTGVPTVRNGTIVDAPAFSWRAFMLDEGRHFQGKQTVFKLLDEMAFLKMNVFHWHLTDDQGWRIEIKKYPRLTEIGSSRDSTQLGYFNSTTYSKEPHKGYYTQEDIKEIVAYAGRRHITVVPEIEMPGHSSAAIASYSWLGTSGKEIGVPGTFGVHYDVYNVADPRVLQFLEDVLDEVIELFPSKVIHIGGDEIRYNQWKESKQIQAYMAAHQLKTPAQLQVLFTNNISNMLAKKGRQMMGWNEITGAKLHEYQSKEDAGTTAIEQVLAPGTIVHFWKGDIDLVRQTAEKGYRIVNSYHVYTYLDYSYKSIPLSKAYAFNPIPEGLPAHLHQNILGMGCQMWGEFTPTVESVNKQTFPRIAAYAEGGWTQADKKKYDRFLDALQPILQRWQKQGIVYGEVQ